MSTQKRVFRTWYCSSDSCHVSHSFEKIADVWVSRAPVESSCTGVFHIPSKDSLALAYSVERILNLREYSS